MVKRPRSEVESGRPHADNRPWSGRRSVRVAGPLLLVVVGVAVYWGTLDVPFIFDDYNAIVDNPSIRQVLPLSRSMTAPEQSTVAGRPAVALSLALNYAVSGLEPWSYHLVNIGIHLLAALALFGIVSRTLSSQRLSGRDALPGRWFAVAVAAVWMVHPLHTEAVTYVSTRTESLMGLFFLLSLYAHVRSTDSARPGAWSIACVVSAALAIASKEVAAALPVVLLAYDAVFVSNGVVASLRRRPALWAALAATWLILLVSGGARGDTVGFGFAELGPVDYARTQSGVIWHYLRLSVWPHPLVLDYFDWPIARHGSLSTWLAATTLLALGLASLWFVRRRHWLGFLGVWLFAILAPTSSVVPIVSEVAAERRMYLPLVAVVVLAAGAVWWLAQRLPPARRPVTFTVAAVVACVALGSATIARNRVYGDEIGIWEDTLAKRPGNARAMENLAVVLIRRGERDRAAELFRRALESAPGSAVAMEGLGGSLLEAGRRQEGVALLRRALSVNPAAHDALENLGLIALEEGRLGEAVEMLRRSASLRPDDPLTRLNLANALLAAGETADATAELGIAVELAPDNAHAHARLALLLAAQGEAAEADRHAWRALELEPDNAEVRRIVAGVPEATADGRILRPGTLEADLADIAALVREGRSIEAREALADLVERVPNGAQLAALAQRCFGGLDRKTAVELLRVAVAARPSEPELHLALGRLMAALQSDREALAAFQSALSLRPGWRDAGNSLALLLATAADPSVRNAEESLRIARELVAGSADPNPLLLGTLGVALGSAGDRSRADVVLSQAVAEATARGERAVAAHLEQYRTMVADGWPPPPGGATARDADSPPVVDSKDSAQRR